MTVVLVTGGTGLIGRHVAEALLQRGCFPVLFDLSGDVSVVQHEGRDLALEKGDICDRRHLEATVRKWNVDYVIHTAAMVSHTADKDVGGIYRVNIGGTDNVFAAAVETGVKRVVWLSSGSALGRGPHYVGEVADEQYTHRPSGLYAMSKLACEELSRAYLEQGLDNIAFRAPLVFGRGRFTGGAGLFNDMVRNVALGKPATLWMPYATPWQYLYAPDMSELLVGAMLAPRPQSHIFNGPSLTSSADEIVGALRALRPNAAIEVQAFQALLPIPPLLDGSLASQTFDFQPAYDLSRALNDLVAHYSS